MHNRGARVLRFFVALVAFAAVLGCVGLVAFLYETGPMPQIPPEGILFNVGKGDVGQSLGSRLEREGLIRSTLAFRVLAKLRGSRATFKVGTYRIRPDMGTEAILALMLSGRQALVKVTVPEGFTLSQTAGLLDRLGVTPASEFVAASHDPTLLSELGLPAGGAEGYLFPDTYFLPQGFGGAAAVRSMVEAFRDRLARIPEAASLSPLQLNSRIILASIVEREYKQPDEAPLIASVFDNRLRIGMALQSCATVVYVMTEREGRPHPEVIYDRDLKIADPYNSYLHRGLPPGPICSPGLTALKAVFYPATSSYLYFRLVDPSAGRHHFSATLEEHIDARSLFIKQVGS